MVRVRLLAIRATPDGVDKVGTTITVTDEVARLMVADRTAELVDDPEGATPPGAPIRTAEHPAAKAGRTAKR